MKFSKIYLMLAAVFMCLPVYIAYFALTGHFPSFSGGLSGDTSYIPALKNSFTGALLCAAVSTVVGGGIALFFTKIKERFSVFFTKGTHYEVYIFNIIVFAALWFIIYLNGESKGFVTLGHCMICIPLVFCMVNGFTKNTALLARCSAEIGASPIQVFFDIILPSFLPAAAVGFIASFAVSFNDVVIAHIISRGSPQCFSLWLINAARSGTDVGFVCAVMLAATACAAVVCAAVCIRADKV